MQPDIRLSPPNGDSRVSRAQPRINAYEILLQHDWLLIFSRHNRFAETHSHLQLSYHITDRLLAAGNDSSSAKVSIWKKILERSKKGKKKHIYMPSNFKKKILIKSFQTVFIKPYMKQIICIKMTIWLL